MTLLQDSDSIWGMYDVGRVRNVAAFLETLPPVFAELEHLRLQADTHASDKAVLTRTIRELRDQLVVERGISDERLLKIEKLKPAATSDDCPECSGINGFHDYKCPRFAPVEAHNYKLGPPPGHAYFSPVRCKSCCMAYGQGQAGLLAHRAECKGVPFA